MAERALLELNRAALDIADRDDLAAGKDSPARTHRVNLGMFVFVDAASP